jgi:hypothetical protein
MPVEQKLDLFLVPIKQFFLIISLQSSQKLELLIKQKKNDVQLCRVQPEHGGLESAHAIVCCYGYGYGCFCPLKWILRLFDLEFI